MRQSIPWILVAGLTLIHPARGADGPRTDQARFQGSWALVSMDRNGEHVIPEGIEDSRVVFEGDGYRLERGGKVLERGTFRVNAEASPSQVDTTPTEGPDAGKTIRGIYAFEGETLKTCVAPPGGDRPSEFAAKAGTDHMLFIYKRQER